MNAMNAMDKVTDAYYAQRQWEKFRDRIVKKQLTYGTVVHDYFKTVDEMNRTKEELRQWGRTQTK